jgi:hypothetical protein
LKTGLGSLPTVLLAEAVLALLSLRAVVEDFCPSEVTLEVAVEVGLAVDDAREDRGAAPGLGRTVLVLVVAEGRTVAELAEEARASGSGPEVEVIVVGFVDPDTLILLVLGTVVIGLVAGLADVAVVVVLLESFDAAARAGGTGGLVVTLLLGGTGVLLGLDPASSVLSLTPRNS